MGTRNKVVDEGHPSYSNNNTMQMKGEEVIMCNKEFDLALRGLDFAYGFWKIILVIPHRSVSV